MRFIGNKENILDKIYKIISERNIYGDSIFDLFAGTTNVGKLFKKLGYQVYTSDLLYFSYVLQRAYIVNNKLNSFENLLHNIKIQSNSLFSSPLNLVVEYLNNVNVKEGFIFNNYTPEGTKNLKSPRMYFSNENGKIIDTIREQIEIWFKSNFIDENEYFVLLACLIETVPYYANVSGIYAAYQKKWDPRALKKMKLRTIETVINKKVNYCFNENSIDLISKINVDIFYLDPPYNQRQYAPNYHIMETIAKYDNPAIKGISGLRNYEHQKSSFCNADTGLKDLYYIAKNGLYKTLILSYNTEGIMPKIKILDVLGNFGDIELFEFDYLRFKSNSNGNSKHKKYIKEQLYILRKNEK